MAAVTVDSQLRIVQANAAAADFYGLELDDPAGREVSEALIAPADHGPIGDVIRTVLAGGRWNGELSVVRRGDVVQRGLVSVSPLRHDGRIDGVLVLAQEIGTSSGRAERLSERLTRLARVTTELLVAENLGEVSDIVIEHMADAAGATVASLSVPLSEDTMQLVGLRGGMEGASSRFRTYPVHGTPAGDSVRTGHPLVLCGRNEIASHYPDLETAAQGERSLVCLPLVATGRVLGVATLSFPGVRRFDGPEMEFFRVMSDTCAQAVERVQALAAAADRASKLRFLAEATDELASSLDYEHTLRSVARLAVPWFADWCSIALGIDGELRTLEVAHVDPQKVALAEEFNRRYPPDPDSGRGSYQVFRSGRSELIPEITDEMIDAGVRDEDGRRLIRQLGLSSAMSVPLKANDKVLGVITWVSGERGRRFGAGDLAFGEDLARRAAVAIDNAQLHTEVQQMAVRLQRAVLPETLPRIDGWDMAAHYLPSGHLDAGGDFYDVLPLGEGRIALFVGDVTGHGVHAAAAMAQMRSAIRAFAAVDPDPQHVLQRLDRLFDQYQIDQLVTMVYAVVDPARHELTLANAGHPPPILLRADASSELMTLPEDVLLGADGSERPTATVPFHPGDALLAFTDGLVERRSEHLDIGMDRLLLASEQLPRGVLADNLVRLVAEVRDPTRDDDVAALIVRRTAR